MSGDLLRYKFLLLDTGPLLLYLVGFYNTKYLSIINYINILMNAREDYIEKIKS